ncbi:MAG: hypothetical protein JXJ22_13655 [Bacteroidales bacterium]|nr:hypothetical protein [Bacteroidales bacterium]
MQLDIKRTIFKIQLRRFILAILFAVIIILILFINYYDKKLFGISKVLIVLVIAAVYIGLITYEMVREPNYIYFSDNGDKIIFRYFSLSLFNKQKSSIEIPKSEFYGYELEKKSGIKEKIILIQKTRLGVAKYPPVSLTGLNEKEKEKLIRTLDIYKK